MPRNLRPPKPVESFGPELFQALVEGSKREVKFNLPYDKAIRFRLRVNQLREAMRKSNHSQYTAVSQARITIKWPEDTPTKKYPGGSIWPVNRQVMCEVYIKPNDSEFRDVLKSAGVSVEPPSSDNKEAVVEEDILADFLKEK